MTVVAWHQRKLSKLLDRKTAVQRKERSSERERKQMVATQSKKLLHRELPSSVRYALKNDLVLRDTLNKNEPTGRSAASSESK